MAECIFIAALLSKISDRESEENLVCLIENISIRIDIEKEKEVEKILKI